MPIYEYRCAACGHYLDALQKISDPPLRKCPDCGKSKLTRLVSAASFRLKGGGWYETDFKNNGEKKRNLVESGDRGSSSDSDSSTAKPDAPAATEAKDSKPAAAAESAPAKKPKPAAKSTSRPAKKSAAKGSRSARS